MARVEDLNLTHDPAGDDLDYSNIPPQDPNYDHMHEAFDDAACRNAPGVTGDYGASLPVSSNRSVH